MGKFESIGSVQPFLKLQEGEWADVYKAYDTSLQRNVLLKRLKSQLQNDPDVAARFEEEARLMTRIEHPNVVRVLSSGTEKHQPYFIAEFIEGVALADLTAHGRLPVILAVDILRETAKGLHAAHQANIYHRDIKPANILISDEGEVKLTDFGMASITESPAETELRGTLGYLAPELLFDGEPGTASDLFSLGATFYKMLTGFTAFTGGSSTEILDQIVNYDPLPSLAVNPDFPVALVRICAKLLDKNPEKRYQDSEALIRDLDGFLAQVQHFDGREQLMRYVADPEAYSWDSALPRVEELPGEPVGPVRTGRRWGIVAGMVVIFISILAYTLFVLPVSEPVELVPDLVGMAGTPRVNDALQIDPADTLDGRLVAQVPQPAERAQVTPAGQPQEIAVSSPAQEVEQAPESFQLSDSVATMLPLEQQKGLLDVICTPYCTVFLDGDSMGTAPPAYVDSLAPGVYNIQLVHPELPTYAVDVRIESGQSETLRVPLKDFVGSIELSIWPYADVFIDGVPQGRVPPVKTYNLSPGPHALTLIHETLGTRTDTLLVVAGEKHTYSYNMRDPQH